MRGTTVDFWDLTKLLVRRWAIVLPLLILTTGVTALVTTRVEPDFTAMAYVQLIPPVATETTTTGEVTLAERNPWVGLGLETLGNAAIVTISDQRVVEDLKAGGFSDSYTLTISDQSPLVTLEIVGKSSQQVRDTSDQLIARFTENIVTLQSAYGVSTADSITVRRLDMGTNVTKSTSKIKRALIAVAGVGLLLTIAITVGIDAWWRHRRQRRDGLTAGREPQPPQQRQLSSKPSEEERESPPAPEGATVVLPITVA